MIREESQRRIAAAAGPYVVHVVPLLIESPDYRRRVDRVLVVDCPEEAQVARVRARSGLSEDEVRAIMRSQAPRAERLAAADDVIDNGGPRDALRKQVGRAAPKIPTIRRTVITYEYPLNERIRTLLRLEDLFERSRHFVARTEPHDHHMALLTLFEIMEVAGRADLKSDLLQELERQKQVLLSFRNNPRDRRGGAGAACCATSSRPRRRCSR